MWFPADSNLCLQRVRSLTYGQKQLYVVSQFVSAHGGTLKCAFQPTLKLSLQRKNADYLAMTLLEDVQTQHSTVDP